MIKFKENIWILFVSFISGMKTKLKKSTFWFFFALQAGRAMLLLITIVRAQVQNVNVFPGKICLGQRHSQRLCTLSNTLMRGRR